MLEREEHRMVRERVAKIQLNKKPSQKPKLFKRVSLGVQIHATKCVEMREQRSAT